MLGASSDGHDDDGAGEAGDDDSEVQDDDIAGDNDDSAGDDGSGAREANGDGEPRAEDRRICGNTTNAEQLLDN
jgi:hypothetical protein